MLHGQFAPEYLVRPPGTPWSNTGGTHFNVAAERLINFSGIPNQYAGAYYIWPATKKAALLVLLNTDPEKDYKREFRYYDQYTLRDISAQSSFYGTYDKSGMADKLRRMNVSIHMGTIGGIATKIIAFLTSLITASLPVTGFIIWWGKRKKRKRTLKQKS